jgi:hypothetical protein
MLENTKQIVTNYTFLGHKHPNKYQIKEIRFDNAKEFESKNVTDYLSGLSPPIKISFTAPYEHEQAGKIEKIRKLQLRQETGQNPVHLQKGRKVTKPHTPGRPPQTNTPNQGGRSPGRQ